MNVELSPQMCETHLRAIMSPQGLGVTAAEEFLRREIGPEGRTHSQVGKKLWKMLRQLQYAVKTRNLVAARKAAAEHKARRLAQMVEEDAIAA